MTSAEMQSRTSRATALATLERMRSHWWWRPGWRVGRSFYAFHVTFSASPEVAALAQRYQAALDLPTLDPVPAEGLHLTMQGLGFTDDVGAGDLDEIILAATRRCEEMPAFPVEVGPADADAEGVPCHVTPWAPLYDVRTRVRAAIADVWGADRVPEPEAGFMPHVTVAYSNAAADPSPLRVRLAAIDPMTASTTIRAVDLIDLNRDEKVYRWQTVARISLGG